MRRIAFLLLPAALAILLIGLAAPAHAERRIALVIGNGAYPTAPLKNPTNDARDMASALKSLGFEVILSENAGLRQMEDALDQFWASLRKGGTGLFFFAGHGLQVKGVNYLVPVDARISVEQDVKSLCLDANRVLGRMENAGNGLNIVLLDACRNNPFARSWRSADSGLAKMDAPTGTLIGYATAPDSVAADGAGRNGVYTQHLLREMRVAGQTIENALKRVRIGVLNDTGRKQTPWESSSLTGDFYFAGPGQGAAPAPPAVQPPAAPPSQLALAAAPAAYDDLASRLAGRYAFARGNRNAPSPLVLEFSVKDGQLVGTASGTGEHIRLTGITDLRLQGRTLSFRCDYRVGLLLFGGSAYSASYSGELGEDLSLIPVTVDSGNGRTGEEWLVRLPRGK